MSTLSRYKATLQKWGLKENPFRPIPPDDPQELARIFYGRTDKIELALPALYEGRNILIRGAWGIGKTATILTLLHRLQAEVAELNEEMLVLYFGSIPGDSPNDFYRALLFGLADTLKEKDEEAAAIFDSIRGVSFTKAKKNIEGKVNLGILSLGAKPTPSEVQANIEENLYSLLFSLLDRAETTFSKIIIAIDDLDKKDTSAVQEILENSLDLFRMGKRRGFIMTGRGFTNLQEAYLTALGIFSEDISLEAMKPKELYQIALNYLNLVRETPQDSPKPFTPEILNQIVNYAHGSPRQLNLICYDVLKQGTALECDKIDAETFPEIWQKVRKKLDFLTPHLRRLMSIIHQAGGIDEDISDRHLDDLGVLTFVELLPELKNLEQEELLIRVEDESGLRFIPSQLYAPPESQE